MTTKKTFDAVELMRKAREKLSDEWKKKPREEEMNYLRENYGHLTRRRVRRKAG